MNNGKLVDILLVEDNAGDVVLTRKALEKSKVLNNVNVVEDGEEALEYLYGRGKYASATRPDLVLLDLNLPNKGGLDVLLEIKEVDELKQIPVVILTSSEAERDIVKSYKLHANCYIQKPVDFKQFVDVVKRIEGFWFSIVMLPPK